MPVGLVWGWRVWQVDAAACGTFNGDKDWPPRRSHGWGLARSLIWRPDIVKRSASPDPESNPTTPVSAMSEAELAPYAWTGLAVLLTAAAVGVNVVLAWFLGISAIYARAAWSRR